MMAKKKARKKKAGKKAKGPATITKDKLLAYLKKATEFQAEVQKLLDTCEVAQATKVPMSRSLAYGMVIGKGCRAC